MKSDIKHKLIYCDVCKKWINAERAVWLPDGMEGRIFCEKEDNLIGYTSDLDWQLMFPIIRIEDQEN